MLTTTIRRAAAVVVASGLGLVAAPAAAEPPNGANGSNGAGSAPTTQASAWPRGKVFVPKKIFTKVQDDELDQVVLAANPRLYLYPDLDLAADKILVIGLPGWGGRSENFIWTLVDGLKEKGLTRRVVVAAIQDLEDGGPGYQGQGDREHANRWDLGGDTVKAMRRFVARLSDELGHLDVYLVGYSTGSFSGPLLAAAMARWRPKEDYRVKGAVCIGTGSPISASRLKDKQQRVLFIVVPEYRGEETDGKPLRDDQNNRLRAERYFAKLKADGAQAYLRHIETARRHVDWHWGLLSQCRYFRTSRIDPGRGYWPNYQMANPETYSYVRPFILGQAPPEKAPGHPPQTCPY